MQLNVAVSLAFDLAFELWWILEYRDTESYSVVTENCWGQTMYDRAVPAWRPWEDTRPWEASVWSHEHEAWIVLESWPLRCQRCRIPGISAKEGWNVGWTAQERGYLAGSTAGILEPVKPSDLKYRAQLQDLTLPSYTSVLLWSSGWDWKMIETFEVGLSAFCIMIWPHVFGDHGADRMWWFEWE